MSPVLAVLYFLLASSPVWRHESPMSESSESWTFPSTFEKNSIFGGEFESLFNNNDKYDNEFSTIFGGRRHSESAEEPMTRLFWLLRKAIRPTTSTRRHLVAELFGLENPMTSTRFESEESPIRVAKLIKKIAKVNPILIEKLLTRPESLFAVEKVLNKHVPTYLREKIIRRVVKAILSHKMSRRSIVSELFPTTEESSIFNTESSFESLFSNVESPIVTRRLIKKIEKVVRHAEVARLVKKLIKKSHSRRSIVNEMFPTTFDFDFESTTPFSTLFNTVESPISPIMTRRLIKKVLRNPIVLSKVIRRLVKNSHKKNFFSAEHDFETVSPVAELLSTLSHVEPKIVKKIVKKALRHELPVEVVLAKVIRRLVKKNIFENEHELSYNMPVSRKVEKVCRPVFGRHFGLEHFDF